MSTLLDRRKRRPPPPAPTLASPLRILGQIVLLQLAYYAGATVLILFTALVAGASFSPELVLSWRAVRGDTAVGWTLGLCWLIDSAFGAIFILLLVARSKLVPDFGLTVHVLHLLVTSLYVRSLPTHVFWWGLQTASAALMISLGIWACQWRELRPLSFGGSSPSGATRAKKTPVVGPGEDPGDEEEGFEAGEAEPQGLGISVKKMLGILSGGKGGRGEYEMVGMAPRETS